MIYVVGFCLVTKLISRRLHRINEQLGNSIPTYVSSTDESDDETIAVVRVYK